MANEDVLEYDCSGVYSGNLGHYYSASSVFLENKFCWVILLPETPDGHN